MSETLFLCRRRSGNPRHESSYYIGKSKDADSPFGKQHGTKLEIHRDAQKGQNGINPRVAQERQTISLEMPPGARARVIARIYRIENQFPPNERETKQSTWILNMNMFR